MGDDAALLREYVKRKRDECLRDFIEEKSDEFCELVFDGLLCWRRAEAGNVARQECPDDEFIYSGIKVMSFLFLNGGKISTFLLIHVIEKYRFTTAGPLKNISNCKTTNLNKLSSSLTIN